MQNYLSISKRDLIYNAKAAVDYVKTPVIAVVKCNGYGIGIENAVNAWYEAGVRMFAVAEAFEALNIADMNIADISILLLSPCYDDETIRELAKHNVIFTVTSFDCAAHLADVCNTVGYMPRAHVKINTGMGRFGTKYDKIDDIKRIYSVENIDFCGIFSHFALSFEQQYDNTKTQLERFLSVTNALEKSGIKVGTKHIANSVAAILYEDTRLDAVRLGSALVGRLMKQTPLKLKPIGTMYAQVADVTKLNKGDTSGYAMIYKAKSDMTAAVVELGFRHGFGMTRKSDNFRFVDVLRDILHAVKGYKKYDFVIDKSGKKHYLIGRIGNQYSLFKNDDNSLKPGNFVKANVNVLMIDSAITRKIEE